MTTYRVSILCTDYEIVELILNEKSPLSAMVEAHRRFKWHSYGECIKKTQVFKVATNELVLEK